MVLLRRVIGDALRARRQAQHRTLREVSTAANVSLGYLSEIERGQKEASSELLASICDALGAQLSELLRDVSSMLALAEQVDGVLAPVPHVPAARPAAPQEAAAPREPATQRPAAEARLRPAMREAAADETRVTDGQVSVTVRRESPLKTRLMATRKLGERPGPLRPTVYVS